MSGIRLRAGEPSDLAAMLALERGCAGTPQWGETVWRGMFAAEAALRAVFVAEIEKQICGFVVAHSGAGAVELESVAVSESMRRRGVAQALCERAKQWARERGAQTMQLEVRESNAAALGLYQRLGFVQQGRRAKYYKQPEEAAVLMTAKL